MRGVLRVYLPLREYNLVCSDLSGDPYTKYNLQVWYESGSLYNLHSDHNVILNNDVYFEHKKITSHTNLTGSTSQLLGEYRHRSVSPTGTPNSFFIISSYNLI